MMLMHAGPERDRLSPICFQYLAFEVSMGIAQFAGFMARAKSITRAFQFSLVVSARSMPK